MIGHVFERLSRSRLARRPSCAAEPVERRFCLPNGPVSLDEIHPLERHIEPRILRVAQQHELSAPPVRLDLPQPFELPNAVIHVHDVIAGLQRGKVRQKTRRLLLPARPLERQRNVKQVCVSVESELRAGKRDPRRKRCPQQNQSRRLNRSFRLNSRANIVRFTEHIRHFVFPADVRQALAFARAGSGQKHGAACAELRFHFSDARHYVAMKPRTRPRHHFESSLAVSWPNPEFLKSNSRERRDPLRPFFFPPEKVRRGRRIFQRAFLVTLVRLCTMLAARPE